MRKKMNSTEEQVEQIEELEITPFPLKNIGESENGVLFYLFIMTSALILAIYSKF